MIYDEPQEVLRRYGRTGYRVVADNDCLREFFKHGGDWLMYDESCCGGNYTSWELKDDVVCLSHDYCDSKAKIKRDVLNTLLQDLKNWKASG